MIQDVLGVLGIVLILSPVCWGIGKFLCHGWKAWTILTSIAEQFKTNGGSSLRDRVDTISTTLDSIVTMNMVSMNLIAFPLLRADGSGQVSWINRQFTHETGLSEGEAAGLGWLNMILPDHRDHARAEWLSAIKDARSIKIEFTLMDGREAVLEALPLVSVKLGVYGVVGTLRIESRLLHE